MSSDADAWRRVAEAGHTGDEGIARESVAADDPVLRELSLGALERMGRLSDGDLQAAFSDGDHAVRRRAALIAAKRRAVSLTPLLNDVHDGVVEAAAWACGEHEVVSEEEFATLVSLATAASEPLVREAAVAALGAIGDQRGLAAILAGCTDKPAIRRRAHRSSRSCAANATSCTAKALTSAPISRRTAAAISISSCRTSSTHRW